jgi:5-methyltetrahydropteroyltriglutamate--homocysteine methyltransferase
MESYDIGSLPFEGDSGKFSAGAAHSNQDSVAYFEERAMSAFVDKVNSGLDISSYPQFRDMNQMFLEMINGLKKEKEGYVVIGDISLRESGIEEVDVLKRKADEIHEKIGRPFRLRMCVTGPYTLSSLLVYREAETLAKLSDVIAKIVENNIFSGRHGGVEIVTLEEPILGLVDDSALDYGSEKREVLLKSWEQILEKAKSVSAKTSMHLHSTSNEIFWDLKPLDIIETHAEDPFYLSPRTKKKLEEKDKFVKASIGKTIFDELIRKKMPNVADEEAIARVWKDIRNRKLDPSQFLESKEEMKKRLTSMVNYLGEERVPFAGLECGLKSFPNYELAIEYLGRSSEVAHSVRDSS